MGGRIQSFDTNSSGVKPDFLTIACRVPFGKDLLPWTGTLIARTGGPSCRRI